METRSSSISTCPARGSDRQLSAGTMVTADPNHSPKHSITVPSIRQNELHRCTVTPIERRCSAGHWLAGRSFPRSAAFSINHREQRMNLYVGTSGYSYPAWKGPFYPKGLPAKQMLHYYGQQFRTVEINYTFRTLPKASVLENW